MNYGSATIRQFLKNKFSDDELNDFCFDYFPDVYNNFAAGMNKQQKILELLDHCRRQERWSTLVGALEKERPEVFTEGFSADSFWGLDQEDVQRQEYEARLERLKNKFQDTKIG